MKNKRTSKFFSCIEDDEYVDCREPEEAIQEYLDCWNCHNEDDVPPDDITVYGFAPCEFIEEGEEDLGLVEVVSRQEFIYIGDFNSNDIWEAENYKEVKVR